MCKYCKKLREIKDLDEKSYRKIINSWRYRNRKAEKLLSEALDLLDHLNKCFVNGSDLFCFPPIDFDWVSNTDLVWRIKYFLQQDWIGK